MPRRRVFLRTQTSQHTICEQPVIVCCQEDRQALFQRRIRFFTRRTGHPAKGTMTVRGSFHPELILIAKCGLRKCLSSLPRGRLSDGKTYASRGVDATPRRLLAPTPNRLQAYSGVLHFRLAGDCGLDRGSRRTKVWFSSCTPSVPEPPGAKLRKAESVILSWPGFRLVSIAVGLFQKH